MNELFEPVPTILPQKDELTLKELASYSKAIDKLVSIGTHLISWELNDELVKPTSGDESLMVSIFLKRLLELLDSIARSIEIGATNPTIILLRTLLEIALSLEYLLTDDTEEKIKCVLISDLYRQSKNYEEAVIKKIVPDLVLRQTEVKKLINLPSLKTVKDEFVSLNTNPKNGQFKNRELKWYNLFTKYNTLSDLALSLKKIDLYTVVYKIVDSNVIHSTDLLNGNVVVRNGTPVLVQMRNSTEILEVAKVVFSIGKSACDKFAKRMIESRRQEYIWAIQMCKKQHQQITMPYLYRG